METTLEKDEKYMRLALEEAKLALEADEVPIGAIIVAGGRIVYGASDPKRGFSTISDNMLHPRTVLTAGILREECEALMKNFFAKLR